MLGMPGIDDATIYDYETPNGSGDYFFQYVFNPAQAGFTNGGSYAYIPIQIQDGEFVLRVWAGADSSLYPNTPGTAATSSYGTIQLYDARSRLFFDRPVLVFSNFRTGTAVVPEKVYPSNSALRFDLANVSIQQDLTGTVPVAQLAFTGVRRVRGMKNDPTPSEYKHKEVDFTIPFQFSLALDAVPGVGAGSPTQFTVQVQDFDFELRRVEYCTSVPGGSAVAATREYGDDESVVRVTAVTPGVAGNNIQIFLDGNGPFAPNQPETVTVVGDVISYLPLCNGGGMPIYNPPTQGTNAQLVAAFAASPAASALVTLVLASGPATASGWGKIPTGGFLEGGTSGGGGGSAIPALPNTQCPEFQITLYDATWRARSNAPVNCNRLLHYRAAPYQDSGGNPLNFYPSPGILYPVNSVIRFDVLSLVPPTGNAQTITLAFKGVRRLPC